MPPLIEGIVVLVGLSVVVIVTVLLLPALVVLGKGFWKLLRHQVDDASQQIEPPPDDRNWR